MECGAGAPTSASSLVRLEPPMLSRPAHGRAAGFERGPALRRHRLDAGAHLVKLRSTRPPLIRLAALATFSPRAGRRRSSARRLELVPGGDAHFVEVRFVGAG